MSDSDDEAPEQVSFKSAKTAVEKERLLVNLQKENDRKIAKLKRKLKQEAFLIQKQEKEAKQKRKEEELRLGLDSQALLDELRAEMAESDPPIAPEFKEIAPVTEKEVKKPKKIYRDLNIEVRTLSGLKADRAASAASFKDKRLSKVHRESVGVNLIHAEKLMAAGKL